MSKRLLSIAGAVLLSLTTAGLALAQETQTTTTTTAAGTTVTQTTQNPDGSWTVVEYPVGKEVIVDLTPSTTIPGAKGTAKVMRMANGTTINVDLAGLTTDTSGLNLYAVDPMGRTTLLGPVTVNNGVGTFSATTTAPLDKFMLVLSPDANLTTFSPTTNVLLRSAVPQGLAVVPLASHGERDGAAVGERVSATTTANTAPAYSAPLLGIPGFRRGTDTEMKINLSGAMTGSRANVYIEPRKDGPTTIKMRFHELKDAPAGQVYALWAVSPDNKYVRLGQIVNTGGRNEAQIQTETALQDFGLLITMESEFSTPTGTIVGTIIK
ncbi:MAG TPA: anti-sigma factor [Pyrinomonadaceae bacterium]|nr:anti-sigma factor [Pyrinomonadaceae bacterium]